MIDGRSGCRGAAVASLLVAAAMLVASADKSGASEGATQTVRMAVTEASVFDVPTALVVLTAPVAPRRGGIRGEASLVSRYTIIEPSDEARVLTANWSQADRAPRGCHLRLEIVPMTRASTVQAEGITVSPVAQRVLAFFGSSSTETARADGTAFKYTLEVADRGAIDRGEHQAVTVTLTLMDLS